MLLCHRLVHLDRQIVLDKSSFEMAKYMYVSGNLFVEKLVHPICRVVYKFFSSQSFVKSRRLWVQRTHTMGFSPTFLGGPGECSPEKFLKTGTLENAFPGIMGHETAQTFEE